MDTPDTQSVARLFELAREGEVANDEFLQLDRHVYGKMFETYSHVPLAVSGEVTS